MGPTWNAVDESLAEPASQMKLVIIASGQMTLEGKDQVKLQTPLEPVGKQQNGQNTILLGSYWVWVFFLFQA